MNRTEHDTVFAELAWHANGTLAPAERPRVLAHLGACAVCRSELRFIEQTLGAAGAAPLPDAAQIERALQRTLQRLGPEPAAPAARVPSWRQLLMAAWRAGAARPLMAGAAALALGLAVALPVLLQQAGRDDDYRTLTSASDPATASRLSLRVAFKRAMTPAQVAGLLDQGAASASVQRVSPTDYIIVLPASADLQAVSSLYDHLEQKEAVASVQLSVKSQP